MHDKNPVESFLLAVGDAVMAGSFVKLSLNKPNASAGVLKSIDIRPISVKRELKLSFTYHNKTNDVVKNYAPTESLDLLRPLLADTFAAARLCTTECDITCTKTGLTRSAPSQKQAAELSHDRSKTRIIESANKPYLHALGISDAKGVVYKNAQDKFRQINKYIEILDGLLKPLPKRDRLRIVDMGAGKGYLTFALYDHVTNTLGLNAEIIGVEYRADLVEKCNDIAHAAQFKQLKFVQGSIADYDCTGADIVIALHACDTATDDAIAKAIHADASLIVVAPCCHKQIRRAFAKPTAEHPLAAFMQYGTYVERIGEMVTDGMRAQLMELADYSTNLFEFISGEHTPKNVMIVATKLPAPRKPKEAQALRDSLAATKAQFGISHHQLEKLLKN